MGQKPKTIQIWGNVIKKQIFFAIPKSPTQMGSLSVKNANEKFSRLGTFNCVRNGIDDISSEEDFENSKRGSYFDL